MDFKNLKPYVRQASEKKIKANVQLPIRWHVAYQIAIITKGEAIMYMNEQPYELSAGVVVFIPPNEPHRYSILSDFAKLIVFFDANYDETSRIRNISSSIPPETLPANRRAYLQENIYDFNVPYVFKPDNFKEYLECWHDIKEEIKRNNSFVSEIKMTKLLNLVHEHIGITKIKNKIDYCEAIKDYVDAGFEKIITLEEISELFQINKFTISKKFKERYGRSIIAYYNDKRLNYAKEALLKPNASVTKISEYLSFTDIYTFSKFFKMHTGVSPRAYKDKNAKP